MVYPQEGMKLLNFTNLQKNAFSKNYAYKSHKNSAQQIFLPTSATQSATTQQKMLRH